MVLALFYDPADTASVATSAFASDSRLATRTVPVVRLSNYIHDRVDLLKLDVEGMETEVLGEISAAGKLPRIERAIVEFHPHKGQPENSLPACVRLLTDSGFHVVPEEVPGATMIHAHR